MNIPLMKLDNQTLLDLSDYSHSLEMENLSIHLYLEYKGARTGVIEGDDPFEEPISGISPKGFALLMLASLNMCFRPAAGHPNREVMLAVPVSFGTFHVYSMLPGCWKKPTSGSRYLGFTMIFNQHHRALASIIQAEYPDILVLPEPECEQLVLASYFTIDEEVYLADICDEVYGQIQQFSEIDKRLSALS
ncbi:hypothetical protein [Alishewanella sp. HL-SH06]|uniref:hypothetical protein n=1 Tax=Alishewanella sp. HL-SH06 TaxID=3461144 RepID=UPI0040424A1A